MELANIEKLLENYLNAKTTLKEEQELHAYFCSEKVASHLEKYRIMFNYFEQSKNEASAKSIDFKPKKTTKEQLKWFSMVITITLLIFVYLGFDKYDRYQKKKQLEQVKEALHIFTTNLNKGNKALYDVSFNINKAVKHTGDEKKIDDTEKKYKPQSIKN